MKALYVLIKGLCIILWFRIKNGPKPKEPRSMVNTQTVAALEAADRMLEHLRLEQELFKLPEVVYKFAVNGDTIDVYRYNSETDKWNVYDTFIPGRHYKNTFK